MMDRYYRLAGWLGERFSPGPVFGWACVIFLVLIPLVWYLAQHSRHRPALRFSSLEHLKKVGRTWAQRMRFVLPLLRAAAIVALVIALARPQSGGEYVDAKEGIAIQMVLDVSGSMEERDFIIDGRRVRRLDAVKRVFRDFVLGGEDLGGRESDLIGMTTFAMYADTACPLSLDHGTLADLLDETDIPGWVDGRKVRDHPEAAYTALGDAIVMATDDLRRAGEQAVAGVPGAEAAKSRVMILLTDGANNPAQLPQAESPDPREAARLAATLGIKVYTIGALGAAPSRGFGFGRQRRQVDEPLLRDIARVTGGKYFRATDTDSLVTIYDEIDRLERRTTGERSFHDDIATARFSMMVALAVIMAELLLVSTRYRKIP